MTTYELAGKFVADGAIACRGGRTFVAFKPPNQQRNVLYEVQIASGVASLVAHGSTPGTYYKDGNCALAFDDVSGELLMLNFCSPNPATGGDARPVLWRTGIVVPLVSSSTVDTTARANAQTALDKIAALITKLHQV